MTRKITEIIPDKIPAWIQEAIDSGQYFNATQKRIADLEDLAIWMTGCGYDFNQHEYFRTKRDELLKGDVPRCGDEPEAIL